MFVSCVDVFSQCASLELYNMQYNLCIHTEIDNLKESGIFCSAINCNIIILWKQLLKVQIIHYSQDAYYYFQWYLVHTLMSIFVIFRVWFKMRDTYNKRPMGLDTLLTRWHDLPSNYVSLVQTGSTYLRWLFWLIAKCMQCNLLQENSTLIHKT